MSRGRQLLRRGIHTGLRDQPLQFGNARAAIGAGFQLSPDLGGGARTGYNGVADRAAPYPEAGADDRTGAGEAIRRLRMRARNEEAPVWRCHDSDDWFRRTASMASAQGSQASCQAAAAQRSFGWQTVTVQTTDRPQRSPHPKFAPRSNAVRRTRIVQALV